MHLAIINQSTHIVENVIVPPVAPDTYTPEPGFIAVETETGGIGDTYTNGVFIPPG